VSISNLTNRVAYTGDGATTAFAVAFPFHDATDLVVIETIIATGAQSVTVDYTISGIQDALGHFPNGGTVNANTAPPATVTWTIYRDMPLTQSVDLVEGDPLPVNSSIEAPLDKLAMTAQRTRELVTRTLRQPDGDATDIPVIPGKIARASKYLSFDGSGNPTATAVDPPSGSFLTLPGVVLLSDFADLATAVTTIGSVTHTTLIISTSAPVAATMSVTDNITLWFTGIGEVSVAAAQILTIDGPIQAPFRKIFTGAGTIALGSKFSQHMPVAWWGTIGDNSADDYADINKARATATLKTNGASLLFNVGVYKLSTSITFDADIELIFNKGAILSPDSAKVVTINGSISAPSDTIFAGAGTVAFGGQSVNNINAEWMAGANDTLKMAAAVAALKAGSGRGKITIPSSMDTTASIPALGLSNGQAITLVDERNWILSPFFSGLTLLMEARDNSGGYASELRIRGKQNPAIVLDTISDGNAAGFPIINKMATVLFSSLGVPHWQLVPDSPAKGEDDFLIWQYANLGTGGAACRIGVDANDKTRWDFTTQSLKTTATTITGATNATPIVITTSTPHGAIGVHFPVTIAGVLGNTAANGDWLGVSLTSTTFQLRKSVGNGAYTSGGTATVQNNAGRAILNVPALQGAVESIYAEGVVLGQRFDADGTPLVAGDFALSAGWGTTASVGAITANDQRGRFEVTSAGTGQGANPTITITFKDLTWGVIPTFVVARTERGAQPTLNIIWATTATTLVITLIGTPVAAEIFAISYVGMG